MAIAMKYDPRAFTKATVALNELAKLQKTVVAAAMTDRQRELNRRLAYFRSQQYDNRGISWRATKILSLTEFENAAREGQMPAGYFDATQKLDDLPYEFRRPLVQYALPRLIVNRFTDLLFAEGSHPQITIPGAGNGQTQEWVEGLLEAARFWQRMAIARDMGGAMGSVAVGFKFVNGRPVLEVHDPRWCTPTIRDRATWDLDGLEIKYMIPVDNVSVDDKGKQITVTLWYWYRRTIDAVNDTTYQQVLVDPNVPEPEWVPDPALTFAHGLGFCPVRWIQNLPVDDEIDGVADCEGIWDSVEQIDGLMSTAVLGSRANSDPTTVFRTKDQSLDNLKKGSGNALRVEPEGGINYLEMEGSGIKVSLEVRKDLRNESLEVAQCVLDVSGERGAPVTATETRQRYASMFNRGRRLREQYGAMGAKPLIDMMLEGSRKIAQGMVADASTQTISKVAISLPPLVKNGELVDRTPGAGKFVEFKWPGFVEETTIDAQAAATAASTARTARIIDLQTAVEFLADSFKIDDVQGVIDRLKQESDQQQAAMTQEILAGAQAKAMNAPPSADPEATMPAPAPPPPIEQPQGTEKGKEDPFEQMTVGEAASSIANLFKVGDVATAEILRQALAKKLGVQYLPEVNPQELAAAAKPLAEAMKAGSPAPGGGGGSVPPHPGGGTPPAPPHAPPSSGAPPTGSPPPHGVPPAQGGPA